MVPLHEDLHEELYDLPTPKKPATAATGASTASGEISPTLLESSLEPVTVPSDDDGLKSPIMDDEKKKKPVDNTGAHKDWLNSSS